jgi:AraC-like DNA-binding protein
MQSMDVLSDVLSAVRLTGAIFFDHHVQGPFAGASPASEAIAGKVMPGAEHVIQFHAVLSGSCWTALIEDPASSRPLEAGDIVIYPMGDTNLMSSSLGMSTDPDLAMYVRPTNRRLPYTFRNGEGPESYHIVCGFLGCDSRPFNPVLEALPPQFCARLSAATQGWLLNMLRVAANESEFGGAGSEIILAKFAEVMFVEVVRNYVARLPEDSRGWLSGLRDRHVGQALQLIHSRAADDWALHSLAREVGLSRSVFADRFAHYVGVSPMHYLGRWRMQLAARRLVESTVSIAQAGAEVGYESEAAFNRAFKKHLGLPPGAWRTGRLSNVAAGAWEGK